MVPYEEPMDTCPDCSDIPCDCGLPAGYQSDIRFAANFAPHIKVVEASKVAEIIQQRDDLLRYNEAFRQEALICANCDAISKEEYDRAIEQRDGLRSAVDYASDQLIRITEQLDRLVEALEHTMKHMRHSLNCPARISEELHACNCQMEWAYDNATEALQSLNQPTQW